jgi:hypothetical protein
MPLGMMGDFDKRTYQIGKATVSLNHWETFVHNFLHPTNVRSLNVRFLMGMGLLLVVLVALELNGELESDSGEYAWVSDGTWGWFSFFVSKIVEIFLRNFIKHIVIFLFLATLVFIWNMIRIASIPKQHQTIIFSPQVVDYLKVAFTFKETTAFKDGFESLRRKNWLNLDSQYAQEMCYGSSLIAYYALQDQRHERHFMESNGM